MIDFVSLQKGNRIDVKHVLDPRARHMPVNSPVCEMENIICIRKEQKRMYSNAIEKMLRTMLQSKTTVMKTSQRHRLHSDPDSDSFILFHIHKTYIHKTHWLLHLAVKE